MRHSTQSEPAQTYSAWYANRSSNRLVPMSALGKSRHFRSASAMSVLPPIATATTDSRKRACPLYPRKRTCAVQLAMSALGQADMQARLFDHLVGALLQTQWHR